MCKTDKTIFIRGWSTANAEHVHAVNTLIELIPSQSYIWR